MIESKQAVAYAVELAVQAARENTYEPQRDRLALQTFLRVLLDQSSLSRERRQYIQAALLQDAELVFRSK